MFPCCSRVTNNWNQFKTSRKMSMFYSVVISLPAAHLGLSHLMSHRKCKRRRRCVCVDTVQRQLTEWRGRVSDRCMNKWLCHPNCCSWMKHFIGRYKQRLHVNQAALTDTRRQSVRAGWLVLGLLCHRDGWLFDRVIRPEHVEAGLKMVCLLFLSHSHKQFLFLSLKPACPQSLYGGDHINNVRMKLM